MEGEPARSRASSVGGSSVSTESAQSTASRPRYTASGWVRAYDLEQKPGARDRTKSRQVFVRQTRQNEPWDAVIMIDTRVGDVSCKEATSQQWRTVITAAKSSNNVPEEMKTARLTDATTAAEPIPLEAYSKALNEKRARRTKQQLSHPKIRLSTPDDVFFERPYSPENMDTLDHVNNNAVGGDVEMMDLDLMSNYNTSPAFIKPVALGCYDLSFVERARQEDFNDFKPFWEDGRQKVYKESTDTAPSPRVLAAAFSPGKYALSDCSFKLDMFAMPGSHVTSCDKRGSGGRTTTQSITTTLRLEWCGQLERQIQILHGAATQVIPFEQVSAIAYNRSLRLFYFQGQSAGQGASTPDCVIKLSQTAQVVVQKLVTLCRALVQEPARKCDQEPEAFFDKIIKGFSDPRQQQASPVRRAKRHSTTNKTPRLGSRPLLSTIEPAKLFVSPESRELSDITNQVRTPVTKWTKFSDDMDWLSSPSSTPPLDHSDLIENDIAQGENEKPQQGPPLSGLYYVSSGQSHSPIPVHLNDLVVRLRGEAEMSRSGQADEFDIFDGPWRIIGFEQSEDTSGITAETDLAKILFRKGAWERIAKTKVELNFPAESQADRWVEIRRLLPARPPKGPTPMKLHPASLAVVQCPTFMMLRQTRRKHGIIPSYTPVYVTEIKKGVQVAVIEANPTGTPDGEFKVEKLRAKRLRVFDRNTVAVEHYHLKTETTDSWVQRLLKTRPDLGRTRTIVAEYKVHWQGWPDEDDSWELGFDNIDAHFIKQFDEHADPLKDAGLAAIYDNPEYLVYPDDIN